jgi:hypothetical protein
MGLFLLTYIFILVLCLNRLYVDCAMISYTFTIKINHYKNILNNIMNNHS